MKLKTEVIRVIEKEVAVASTMLSIDEIYAVLKKVEKERGFLGFRKYVFEAGEFPVISYVVEYRKYENNNTKTKDKK